jgi:hypothetical protein
MLGVRYDDGSGDDSLIAKWKFKVLTRRKQFIFIGLVEKDRNVMGTR